MPADSFSSSGVIASHTSPAGGDSSASFASAAMRRRARSSCRARRVRTSTFPAAGVPRPGRPPAWVKAHRASRGAARGVRPDGTRATLRPRRARRTPRRRRCRSDRAGASPARRVPAGAPKPRVVHPRPATCRARGARSSAQQQVGDVVLRRDVGTHARRRDQTRGERADRFRRGHDCTLDEDRRTREERADRLGSFSRAPALWRSGPRRLRTAGSGRDRDRTSRLRGTRDEDGVERGSFERRRAGRRRRTARCARPTGSTW